MRRILTTLVLALSVGLTGLAAPARADDPGTPLERLLAPSTLDPLISTLVALPTPYHPYTGDVCPQGRDACLEDVVPGVIDEMKERLAPLAASCDHDAVFALAYLRVTQNVHQAVRNGYFADPAWLTRIDAVFAQMYFDTYDAWHSGRKESVPPAWRIALRAADRESMSALGDFMLGMNAHINNDFPYVLARVGLTDADGSSHKPDHNAYNDRLDSLYHPVFTEIAARFDPSFDDVDVGPVDELAVGAIMRGWREMVWRHAEALVLTRGSPLLHSLVEAEIAQYAATQARLIKQVPIFRAAASPRRDVYCATHHDAAPGAVPD